MMFTMSKDGAIFFSAFEPSGDVLAAALIEQLRQRHADRPIYALGGPKMEAAGATLLERTTDHAVMLAGAVSEAKEHLARVKRTKQWLSEHPIALHVPTDSPAANWAICKQVRQLQPRAKIVHLAAPQLWAWGPWRIHKLRRLTDRVLCLLPFEPSWFESRGVGATFVGHPLFDKPNPPAGDFGDGSPKLALLPGSRAGEITKNWPTMRSAYVELAKKFPHVKAVVAASDEARAAQLRTDLPTEIELVVGQADRVLAWADVTLVVSGTATLQCARQRVPMVTFFNASAAIWHGLGRWLIHTHTFTLPNLMGEALNMGHVVPELVPHFGEVSQVVRAMEPLMVAGDARIKQQAAFDRFAAVFHQVHFGSAAADAVESVLDSACRGR